MNVLALYSASCIISFTPQTLWFIQLPMNRVILERGAKAKASTPQHQALTRSLLSMSMRLSEELE